MALKKQIEHQTGVTYEHHTIGSFGVDRLENIVRFEVLSYLNKGAWEASKQGLPFKGYKIEYQDDYGELIPFLYNYLKTEEDFVGSEDD